MRKRTALTVAALAAALGIPAAAATATSPSPASSTVPSTTEAPTTSVETTTTTVPSGDDVEIRIFCGRIEIEPLRQTTGVVHLPGMPDPELEFWGGPGGFATFAVPEDTNGGQQPYRIVTEAMDVTGVLDTDCVDPAPTTTVAEPAPITDIATPPTSTVIAPPLVILPETK